MSKIQFAEDSWEEYLYWLTQDKRTLKRINALLKDIQRSPFDGIGKPEPLAHDLSGLWSRRIDSENRLVYRYEEDTVKVVQCLGHYKDK